MRQRTLVIFKPEVFEKNILALCLNELRLGQNILVAQQTLTPSKEIMTEHYARILSEIDEEQGRSLLTRMTRGPVMVMAIEGVDVLSYMTEIVKPYLRGLYADDYNNVIHTSDVDEQIAEAEIKLWFPDL